MTKRLRGVSGQSMPPGLTAMGDKAAADWDPSACHYRPALPRGQQPLQAVCRTPDKKTGAA
jgi:hypothetical protein